MNSKSFPQHFHDEVHRLSEALYCGKLTRETLSASVRDLNHWLDLETHLEAKNRAEYRAAIQNVADTLT